MKSVTITYNTRVLRYCAVDLVTWVTRSPESSDLLGFVSLFQSTVLVQNLEYSAVRSVDLMT